eukprot:TRINITY_DN77733_c2_g1_i1.p1 TRINITY_DN77733_c2_g1~~TRINITY_DN77733_c2_g1_i1.p1  ORF type:complete len:208 (-),score=9.81 TRINITY_DN77733_c2_g1_i1:504-1127(-)
MATAIIPVTSSAISLKSIHMASLKSRRHRDTTDDATIWQIFFLPKDDLFSPQAYIAFCPFTKIIAEGKTIEIALRNWLDKACGVFHVAFSRPTLTARKVWLGEYETPKSKDDLSSADRNTSIFVIDFSSIQHPPVAVCPEYSTFAEGKSQDWRRGTRTDPADLPAILMREIRAKGKPAPGEVESSWMDWKITCTPIRIVGNDTIPIF